jgi:hypothetical protein
VAGHTRGAPEIRWDIVGSMYHALAVVFCSCSFLLLTGAVWCSTEHIRLHGIHLRLLLQAMRAGPLQ